VETHGLALAVLVHPANVQDRDGGLLLMQRARAKVPTVRKLWVDHGYAGRFVRQLRDDGIDAEVVKHRHDRIHGTWRQLDLPLVVAAAGFEILARRWVVERTFGWLGRHRRLAKDYEMRIHVSEAIVWVALLRTLVRRLAIPEHPATLWAQAAVFWRT
jgi:transposase